MPALTLERLDAPGELSTADLGEDPAVVNLWATWCVPCRAELPAFDQVAAEVDGVRILGVNVGEERATAAALVDELDLGFEQYLDPNADLSAELEVTGMPATLFVDTDGQVLEVHSGALDAAELQAKIDEHFPTT